MEFALNPQDTATHRISGNLANNSDEFDVNFAAIGKNNLGSNEANCPSFTAKRT
jgi:hypothetical protein